MLRSSRSTMGLGLVDGVSGLSGAPPPSTNNNPLCQLTTGAKTLFSDVGERLDDGVGALRRMVGQEDDDVELADLENGGGGFGEDFKGMFDLNWMQKLALFAMTFGAGVVLIVLSFWMVPLIVIKPHKFAVTFTVGNVLAITSSWVLVGPRAQIQAMFHPARAVAAGLYIASLITTLLAAFFGGRLRYVLVLASIVGEIVALVWYSLSYIPYARQLIGSVFGGIRSLWR